MKAGFRLLGLMSLSLVVSQFAACQSAQGLRVAKLNPAQLSAHYKSLPDSYFVKGPPGPALPKPQTSISRILLGSCLDEETRGSPRVLQVLAKQRADLFIMMGDNVYGDVRDKRRANIDPELTELRASFRQLGQRKDFQAIRAQFPMMAAWDDHDYGKNDAGREFAYKELAERVHESFWGLDDGEAGQHPGTYYSHTFGPSGQRLQIIILDTRYFRSPLQRTDKRARGKEIYMPSNAPDQAVLGTAQWAWLAKKLREPADLRLIISSIQVLPADAHGYESWSRLPDERQRLMSLLRESKAGNVVFASGDRHRAFLYRADIGLPRPVLELTASSMTFASRNPKTNERDSTQIGDGYTAPNFGRIDIDWTAGKIRLAVMDRFNKLVQEVSQPIR